MSLINYVHKRLADVVTLGTALSTPLTVGSGTTAYVQVILAHNYSTATATVYIYRVPNETGSAGTGGNGNLMIQAALDPQETKQYEFVAGKGMVLSDQFDSIQWKASAASSINGSIDGAEET